MGHTVRLMPPSYVKAYVKRSKNDANDAAAICEAVTRPSMRFVPTKSEQQQSALMLHRAVSSLSANARCCRTRSAGIWRSSVSSRRRAATVRRNCSRSLRSRRMIASQWAARLSLAILARQYAAITTEIGSIEKHIHAWHRSCEESRRLEEIPGVGPIVATALVAEVGDWDGIFVRPQPRRLDWVGTPAAFDWWQGETWSNLETGQSTFAMATRRRRYGRHPICATARHETALARAPDGAPADQGRCGRTRQQDCPHGMGDDGAWRAVQGAEGAAGNGVGVNGGQGYNELVRA